MPISRTLVASAVIAALGGFLFGFDTVVISGAEQKIERLWQLSPRLHGWATSAALWGTVLGAIGGAWPTDRWGRRGTLLWIGALYLISALWSAAAWDVYSFIVARFIGGVGVGISTVAAPLYISEIAPPHARGRLTGLFQFNIVFGILVAYVSNSLLQDPTSNTDWRWMMGIEAVPALLYTVLCFFIPESPRWLISRRHDAAAALVVLQRVNPHVEIETLQRQVDAMGRDTSSTKGNRPAKSTFWSWRLRYPIMLAFLVAMFNQLSGINAILYFAPRILGMTGLESQVALVQSIGIGVTNLVFTMLGLWLIDRVGRRTLLVVGSLGYIASLGAIAAMFAIHSQPFAIASAALDVKAHAKQFIESTESARDARAEELNAGISRLNGLILVGETPPSLAVIRGDANPDDIVQQATAIVATASASAGWGSQVVLWGIFAFVAAHAVGQGAVIWVLIAEVFPNEHRASGQSLGSATHWVFAALLTLAFRPIVAVVPAAMVFGFFAGMMVLHLLWVLLLVPETKGVPLEELQHRLSRPKG